MEFHKALKPFVDSISKLQFSTIHDIKPSPKYNDGSTMDVVTRASCNKMRTEEFQEQLNQVVDGIFKESKLFLSKLGTHFQKELLDIVIHVDRLRHHYFDGQQFKGIEETVQGLDLKNNEAYQHGAMDYSKVETRIEPKEEFYAIILNQIEHLKTDLSELLFDEKQEVLPVEKLQWNVKPAILAALLEELDTMGWISPQLYHGDTSFSKLADICDGIFEFKGTKSSLRSALSNNTMVRDKRELITLPPLKDIIN